MDVFIKKKKKKVANNEPFIPEIETTDKVIPVTTG